MHKPIAFVALVAAAAATSGCGTVQRSLGATRTAPDEFRIVTQAPLTLPPDYNLRPPRPGEPRPSELEPDSEARAALFGQDVGAQASQGERTLVTAAGAAATDPEIRDTIDFESQGIVRRNENFVNRLLAFKVRARNQLRRSTPSKKRSVWKTMKRFAALRVAAKS